MSSLHTLIGNFIKTHIDSFGREDRDILTRAWRALKDRNFEAVLGELRRLKLKFTFDYDVKNGIQTIISELEAVMGQRQPSAAAVEEQPSVQRDAHFLQHVSPDSVAVAPPMKRGANKRTLSDSSKKAPQPAKKKRAAPRCGKCGQQGHTARSKKCPQHCEDASGGGAAKSKTTRKNPAFNMFTAGGGKRKDWESVSHEEKAHYQALADEANVSKRAPVVEKPKEESKEASSEPASATAAKELKDLPEPVEAPPPVPEPVEAPPPVPEPVTPRQEPQLPGEESSDDEEYVEEEDRDRKNTPYLNVRDVIKVTLSEDAVTLVAQASAPRGQAKEFKAAKKIDAFLRKTVARAEEESKEDVSYTPEEDNQFYVASEVEVDDDGVLEEIELGLHKDGTEDEYKFSHKLTVPVRFIEWEIISRADQTVEVTEGDEDDRWRAVLDCLHTYGGEGHPFGVPLFNADGAPLLDDRDQQRYNDIDNIAAIEGEEGVKGVATLLKEEAKTARKVYTDALKPLGHIWKAKRGTDGFIGDVDLNEFVPPGESEPLRQAWLNKVSLSNGPTNDSDVDRYVFDPNWQRPGAGVVRTEEEKDADADQIHIRTWALRVGMQQMPAIEYKMKGNEPKIEYDDDDEDKKHPIRTVASAGRRILVQWGDDEYDSIVIANDPNADPPLLRCEYTRPSVQVGRWTMTKVRHGNEFRYVVEGPESAGEAKEGNFELGKPETFERVQTFFAAHGITDVPNISTDEGAEWGPFDLNFEKDTFKKMELYDGKDRDASNRKEDADVLAEDAAAVAEVKSLAVQEAQQGDIPEDDDPYLNNDVIFKENEYNVEERKFEGGTYLYKIGDQWVQQDELEIKPPEEIVFEEDANRHHGGGSGETKSVDEAEEELDPNAVYIYTDEEGAQHRVKIVTEEYGYGIEDPPKPAPDLAWYWARRNEQVEAVKRQEAIKRAESQRPEEVNYAEWEIRRARLVIDGHRVEGGYDVFKDDVLVATVGNIEELKVKLQELDGDEVEAEDISNIEALWAINEAEVEKYISAGMTTTGSDKSKKDFANGYGGLVDVVDETGKQYERVILAHLEKVSTIEEEAAAAAATLAAEEARVAQEHTEHAGVAVSSSDDSSSDDSADDDSADDDEEEQK